MINCRRMAALLVLLASATLTSLCEAQTLTLLSQNANRLFDNIDNDHQERVLSDHQFNSKISLISRRIGKRFGLPHVIALQEVENHHVLKVLADQLQQQHNVRYSPVLVPGQDISGINVAYLVHPDWRIDRSSQLLRHEIMKPDRTPLFSRPPLLIRLCQRLSCVSVVNVHLRSMRGLNAPEKGQWVAEKRQRQASALARWVNRFQQQSPREPLVLVGDFNALTPPDRHVDVHRILLGKGDNPDTRMIEEDLIERDLIDITQRVPETRRYSYIYKGNRQQLDYLLLNQAFQPAIDTIEFSRIDYRLSDHAALYLRMRW